MLAHIILKNPNQYRKMSSSKQSGNIGEREREENRNVGQTGFSGSQGSGLSGNQGISGQGLSGQEGFSGQTLSGQGLSGQGTSGQGLSSGTQGLSSGSSGQTGILGQQSSSSSKQQVSDKDRPIIQWEINILKIDHPKLYTLKYFSNLLSSDIYRYETIFSWSPQIK